MPAASARRVYLDYAATAPFDERLYPVLHDVSWANANALYAEGREAASQLRDARTRIARVDVLVAGVSRQVVDVGHARLVFAGIGAVVVLDDLVPHLFRGRRLHLPQGARETDARVEPRLAVVIGLVSAAGQGVVLR